MPGGGPGNRICAGGLDRVELQSPQGAGRTDRSAIVGRSSEVTSTTYPLQGGRVSWGKHLGDASKIQDLAKAKSTR